MSDPLASAMDGLAAACDARGWQLAIAYVPPRAPLAWEVLVLTYDGKDTEMEGTGATLQEALVDAWCQVQRYCRALASRGRG